MQMQMIENTLTFTNPFTQALPADPETENTRRQVQNALYSRVRPQPVAAPHLIAFSHEVAQQLGLSQEDITSPTFTQVFSGNKILSGMDPHATCYGGHQFGNWAGQLGDGRAINLGEVATDDGHLMLQLKGAGPTPYSRSADGLAVLRSSVREFLCSEAMYHLGIPTTRALSLIGTGEQVMRDVLYDGHPALEPGAVVCRVSSSFVRFGHFQMLAARNEIDLLRQFADYIIKTEFPHLRPANPQDGYVRFFNEVCERTADLMVHWMRVGFVHGVMNTDNMSIIGETIDYGPYGWLEDFDPNWTPNTTDAQHRRYRYAQQPAIGQWNLLQLANALAPLLDSPKPLETALTDYARYYERRWQEMMAQKLGLPAYDADLVTRLLNILPREEMDMTWCFRLLATVNPAQPDAWQHLNPAYYQGAPRQPDLIKSWQAWLGQYHQVLDQQGVSPEQRRDKMNAVNPKYVLRNYLAQLAIDAAEQGDYSRVNQTLEVLRHPYDEQPEHENYAAKRPEWARTRAGCSMLSCSS